MRYSLYYQAHVKREYCWLFVGALRSFEHLVFDRTLDKARSLFEFFVPEAYEAHFLEIMHYFIERHIVHDLVKLPHRLSQEQTHPLQYSC